MSKRRFYHILLIILIPALLAFCGGRGDRKSAHCRISPTGTVVAGSPITWNIDYRVPDPGFAPDGTLLILFPAAYYSDRPKNIFPQVSDEKAPGYSRAKINGHALALDVVSFPSFPAVLKISAGTEGFKPGDNIEIAVGVSPTGRPSFKAPTAAGSSFALIVLADAEGKGRYSRVAVEDEISVVPAKPARADIVAPAFAGPGASFDVTVRFFDEFGNVTKPAEPVSVSFSEDGESVSSFAAPPPATAVEAWIKTPGGSFSTEGYHYLASDFGGAFPRAVSNPVRVSSEKNPRRIFFGDLRLHSTFSDGSKTPEEIAAFAAGPGALAFAAVSDPIENIDEAEAARLQIIIRERLRLGEFVPIPASETGGDEAFAHYYDRGEVLQDLFSGSPKHAWESINNTGATIPSFNFDDEDFERMPARPESAVSVPLPLPNSDLLRWGVGKISAVEIHSSLIPVSADSPVQRAMAGGSRFGFVSSSAGRDGRPGLNVPGVRSSGLTALETGALTGRTIFDALLRGRTYATTGARMIIRTDLDGHPPGAVPIQAERCLLRFDIAGTAPIRSVEILKDGIPAKTITPEGNRKIFADEWLDEAYDKPCSIHIRVTQSDGEQAWSCPFYLDHPDYASVKSFRAADRGDTVEVLIDSIFGRKTESLCVLKHTGKEIEIDPEKFAKVGPNYPSGRVLLRDQPSPAGSTTYYMLRETNGIQDRFLGPIYIRGSNSTLKPTDNQAPDENN